MDSTIETFYFYIWGDTPKTHSRKLKKVENRIKKNLKTRIVFCAAEEWEYTQEMENFPFPSSKNLEKEIIIGHVKNNTMTIPHDYKIHLWKNSWLFFTASAFGESLVNTRNQKIEKLFMLMNNRDHYWRCMMIDSLSKEDLLKNSYYSWNQENGDRYNYKFSNWKEKPVYFPSEKNLTERILDNVPDEFTKVVFHIVCESTIKNDLIDISEKTWKCILLAQPFIILGNPGIHSVLEEWGFKLYTEIFNYSFDFDPNCQNRVNAIVKQVNNLNRLNFPDSYNVLKEKLQTTAIYNQKRAIEMIKNKEMIPQIVKDTNYYTQMILDAEKNIGNVL